MVCTNHNDLLFLSYREIEESSENKQIKMLEPTAQLPNNVNGHRTIYTCELCGFEPKTINKLREKQDHLIMKHFKEKINDIVVFGMKLWFRVTN